MHLSTTKSIRHFLPMRSDTIFSCHRHKVTFLISKQQHEFFFVTKSCCFFNHRNIIFKWKIIITGISNDDFNLKTPIYGKIDKGLSNLIFNSMWHVMSKTHTISITKINPKSPPHNLISRNFQYHQEISKISTLCLLQICEISNVCIIEIPSGSKLRKIDRKSQLVSSSQTCVEVELIFVMSRTKKDQQTHELALHDLSPYLS